MSPSSPYLFLCLFPLSFTSRAGSANWGGSSASWRCLLKCCGLQTNGKSVTKVRSTPTQLSLHLSEHFQLLILKGYSDLRYTRRISVMLSSVFPASDLFFSLCRHLLHHCFQALMDHGVKVASVLANSFSRRCSYISESDAHVKEKAIQFGFVLGKSDSDQRFPTRTDRPIEASPQLRSLSFDFRRSCQPDFAGLRALPLLCSPVAMAILMSFHPRRLLV